MRSRILAVSCCLWGGALADSERFPLSGIVANGVNVRVAGKLMGGDAQIEFETPARGLAFRFHPDVNSNHVVRSDGSLLDTFGGIHPFKMNEAVTIDFLKTKSMWKVSVNEKRLPWFDFPIAQSTKMTHVRVYSGLQDAQVTLTRPKCTTMCSADECETCPSGACFATSGETCSEEEMTDDAGADYHCCEGAQDGLDSVEVGSWVAIHGNKAIVESACAAFGTDCADSGLEGKIAQVMNYDSTAKSVGLYVPAMSGVNQEEIYTVTPLVLQSHVTTGRVVELDPSTTTVDQELNLITQGAPSDEFLWVYLLYDGENTWTTGWKRHTPTRFGSKASWKALLTSTPADLPSTCTDFVRGNGDEWRARRRALEARGRPCSHFVENDFCNINGEVLPAFTSYYNGDTSFSDRVDDDAGDTPADDACCGCSGGIYGSDESNPPTTGFAVEGTSLLVK